MAPILEIRELKIEEVFTGDKGPHYILFFVIKNVGKVVCRNHLLHIRLPLKVRSTPAVIVDEQPSFNGVVSEYIDEESQEPVHVVEVSAGRIYPGQEVRKALRMFPCVYRDDRYCELYSRTGSILNITLFSDPPSEVRGQTQMTLG